MASRYGGNGGSGGGWCSCWTGSYAADYLTLVGVFAATVLINIAITPFHHLFSLHDLRISYPHAEVERVPVLHDIFYALVLPLLILIAYNLATRAPGHKHRATLLGFFTAMVLTTFLTDVIKNAVGRPRPDLLARCKPSEEVLRLVGAVGVAGAKDAAADGGAVGVAEGASNGLVSIAVCTETRHHVLHDGWRSFPSGHTSFAFAGLGYLSLFFAGQFHVLRRVRGGYSSSSQNGSRAGILGNDGSYDSDDDTTSGSSGRASPLPIVLLCGFPLLGATLIGISRVQDYRHDVYDVSVGALLGSCVTYWSYRRYWPRLGSGRCAEPYPPPAAASTGSSPRRPSAAGGGYGRVPITGGGGRDEEEGLGGGRGVELDELRRGGR